MGVFRGGNDSLPLKGARLALSGLLIAVVVGLSALSSARFLHELVHPDADAPSHTCVIGTFASGHVESAGPVPVLPIPSPSSIPSVSLPSAAPLTEVDHRLGPSRAPPACLRSLVVS